MSMLFFCSQGVKKYDFKTLIVLVFKFMSLFKNVHGLANKSLNKQCGPGQDFTVVTSVFGLECRFAVVIFPHHGLCKVQSHRSASNSVFSFQSSVQTPRQQKRDSCRSLIKLIQLIIFFTTSLFILFLYFKTTKSGEKGCWMNNSQRLSTVLCHPVIRVTGCVQPQLAMLITVLITPCYVIFHCCVNHSVRLVVQRGDNSFIAAKINKYINK